MRTNVYKEKILALLRREHLQSIADIQLSIPEADFSTLFRNIEQLLMSGQVKKVVIDNKSVMYEFAHNSHDHFICNDCGKVEAIHMSHSASDLKDKKIEDITVRGSCEDCIH